MTKTLKFAKVGQCFLLVLGHEPPSEADWDAYLEFLEKTLSLREPARLLVSSAGGAPSAAQRAKLQVTTKPHAEKAKIAVLTASSVVRGAVTALSWFTKGYAAFHPDAVDDSLKFLALSTIDSVKVRNELRMMQRDLIVPAK